MVGAVRTTLEIGPKGKRVVAVAPDWPGLERGAKTEEAVIERFVSYFPRYMSVAKLAGLDADFAPITVADVVERYTGSGSTDFWGISFAFSGIDHKDMSHDELDRELRLMEACWAFFDGVRSRVSPEMRKGPRGGGRDRDVIVNHTLGTERHLATKFGVMTPQGAMLTDEGLRDHRAAYLEAIRTLHAQGKKAWKWPLRYLIRHTAYHTMDHAWEMEDKDLTVKTG